LQQGKVFFSSLSFICAEFRQKRAGLIFFGGEIFYKKEGDCNLFTGFFLENNYPKAPVFKEMFFFEIAIFRPYYVLACHQYMEGSQKKSTFRSYL
jgi:hypothetical protein